jgi:hypothetical protein
MGTGDGGNGRFGADAPFGADERTRLDAIRTAASLAALADVTRTDSEHDAYFAAKDEWRRLRGAELAVEGLPDCASDASDATDATAEGTDTTAEDGADLPGSCVEIDGHRFHVHGITHGDTDAERSFLRDHVQRFRERDASVYCEQGIRGLYFRDIDGVCAMDDYRWAMRECRDRGLDSHAADAVPEFDGLAEEVDSLTNSFREAAFSLIDDAGDVYGDRFRDALGDVASAFLTSHESVATGSDFASFALSREAAADPTRLRDLQYYYERAFLPQPLEREWLRRHDPELEIVTHARNERMADYAVAHNDAASEIHLIVGAAHQPGVRYYLEEIRDGEREVRYEPVR